MLQEKAWAAVLSLAAAVALPQAQAADSVTSVDFSDERTLKTLWNNDFGTAYTVFGTERSRVFLAKILPGKTVPPWRAAAARIRLRLGTATFSLPNGESRVFRAGDVDLAKPDVVQSGGRLEGSQPAYILIVQVPPAESEFLTEKDLPKSMQGKGEAMPFMYNVYGALSRFAYDSKGFRLRQLFLKEKIKGISANALTVITASQWKGPTADEIFWIILAGTARLKAGGQSFLLQPKTAVRIPRGFPGVYGITPLQGRLIALQVAVSPLKEETP